MWPESHESDMRALVPPPAAGAYASPRCYRLRALSWSVVSRVPVLRVLMLCVYAVLCVCPVVLSCPYEYIILCLPRLYSVWIQYSIDRHPVYTGTQKSVVGVQSSECLFTYRMGTVFRVPIHTCFFNKSIKRLKAGKAGQNQKSQS